MVLAMRGPSMMDTAESEKGYGLFCGLEEEIAPGKETDDFVG